MMSDLLNGPHGFHSTAIQASSQSDLPLASAYLQVWPVSLITSPKHLIMLAVHLSGAQLWSYVPNIRWWHLTPANIY